MSVGIFTWLLKYFPKNRAILVKKLGEEKNCQNSFPAILWLKNHTAIKPERGRGGGGKALMARPLRTFFPREISRKFFSGLTTKAFQETYISLYFPASSVRSRLPVWPSAQQRLVLHSNSFLSFEWKLIHLIVQTHCGTILV